MSIKMSQREIAAFVAKGCKITQGPSVAECMKKAAKSTPEAGTLVIRLPLPPRALNPNSRVHWAVKARAVTDMRLAASVTALGSSIRFTEPIIDAVFWHKTKKRRDRDNAIASCKAMIDGLSDAKLWDDDSCVHWGDVALMVDKDDPRLILTIRERKP